MIAADVRGTPLSAAQAAALDRYLTLVEKWNRVYNLTAIRERDRMLTHHVLDSLVIAPHVRGPRVLDVGSGAGLPGIPLAVAKPELHVTLLDCNEKKTAFLRQAVAELGLENADVRTERIESWRTELRFDTVAARAFGELSDLVAAGGRLLARGGRLLAMKGQYPRREIERLPAGFQVREVLALDVPQLDAARHLVIVEAAE